MEQFLNTLVNNIFSSHENNELFDHFIEQINSIPFDHYRQEDSNIQFQLHERVVQNMYILRRNLELHSFRNTSTNNTNNTTNVNNVNNANINTSIHTIPIPISIPIPINRTNNIQLGTLLGDMFDTFTTFLEDQLNIDDYSNLEDTKIVLTEEQFNTLNSVILNEESIKGDCPICMDTMSLNDKLIILKCKHIYHNSCIHDWLTKNSTKCCVCRKDVREELTS
jgi:hypothetical protein